MAKVDLRITDKISWLLSKPKRIKIAVGGRGSAKSIGVGDIMLMFADHGERICCAREFQNSIDDSVHESLSQEIERLGAGGFSVLANEIRSSTGGTIFYKGLARNITSLKSLAGVDRLWIEEGESVSAKSLKVLTPSIRSSAAANDNGEDPPEIWITMNRGSSADAVAQKYLKRAERSLRDTGYYEDEMCMVVQVNYQDNPWFPPELEQERKDDKDNLATAEYDHVWNGAYNDTVADAIIKPEWFDACVDAHIKLGFEPRGVEVVAHDPSDTGSDAKGLAYRYGVVFLDVQERHEGDVNEGADWAITYASETRPDVFIWDGDGLGLSLRRQFNQALGSKNMTIEMFRGAATPDRPDDVYEAGTDDTERTNKQCIKNKRAQYYLELRDRCRRTYHAIVNKAYSDPDDLISFSSEIKAIDQLRAELCRIPQKYNSSGLFQVKSKIEMKAMQIESPNMADAVMMSLANPMVDDSDAPYIDQGVVDPHIGY